MGRKQTFTPIIEALIQIVQMIFHLIDIEIAQLVHVLSFFKFCMVFELFENTKIWMYSKMSGL
jgi:hypothetical protein